MTGSVADGAPTRSPRLTDLRRRLASVDARPTLLGTLGAALVTAGAPGAGSTRLRDPVLESAGLSWLRFGHGLVVSSVLLWCGVALMLAAWVWLGRGLLRGTVDATALRVTVVAWLVPLLVSVPVFSRDTYSYLAQGALLRDGFDPYRVGPVDNPNGLLDDVSPIWTTTTAPYGPAFLLIARAVTTVVGDDVVAGTVALRLCMLPGLALLVWAVPRVARSVARDGAGTDGAVALWVCVLNPLVLVHLLGGVHNEMLMVGLLMAGIALMLARRPMVGVALVAVAVAVKATAGVALPFMVWMWAAQLRARGRSPRAAFLTAAGGVLGLLVAVFAVCSVAAGVGLGWLTALAGSVKIINWLSVPTAAANVVDLVGGLAGGIEYYAVLDVTRIIGIVVIVVALPLLWVRHRHDDRDVLTGMAWAMGVVVLFVPAVLPWYYSWPLAVVSALVRGRAAMAAIAGASTAVMVVFRPDGSHGMNSWVHVGLSLGAGALAWRTLRRAPEAATAAT